MKKLQKFILSGTFILSLAAYSEVEQNKDHELDRKKTIYYATRPTFVAYYKAFDSKTKQWIGFRDYGADNKLDAVIYRDEEGEEVEYEREYYDLSKWEPMFSKVLKESKKGKAYQEKSLAVFLRKHDYCINSNWDKE